MAKRSHGDGDSGEEIQKVKFEQAIGEVRDELKYFKNLQSRITTRVDALEKQYLGTLSESSTLSGSGSERQGQGLRSSSASFTPGHPAPAAGLHNNVQKTGKITDMADVICDFLQYIPGIGTLYQAPKAFVNSLQDDSKHGVPAGLSIIHGASRDLFYYSSLLELEDSVVVHSLFDNEPTNALGHLLDQLVGRNFIRERVKEAVQEHLRNVNAMRRHFLLVHHIEENDLFHTRFLDNRVRIAKYGLTTGAVYFGLLTYESYAKKSLIIVNVPYGFKKGNPVKISWKFDRLWDGTKNHVIKSVGTVGKCKIYSTEPGQEFVEIEVLRNECYYWFTGKVYLGDIERCDRVEAYELVNSSIELKMYSGDPNLPLGTFTKLEMLQGEKD